jgi:uncharacterized protein (TIGR00251 family)
MIELETTEEGVVLLIAAQPRARKNALVGAHGGRLKVAVTQAPEKGKANEAIIKVVAAALDLKRSQLDLFAGAASSQKKFLVRGIDAAELHRRIADHLRQQ